MPVIRCDAKDILAKALAVSQEPPHLVPFLLARRSCVTGSCNWQRILAVVVLQILLALPWGSLFGLKCQVNSSCPCPGFCLLLRQGWTAPHRHRRFLARKRVPKDCLDAPFKRPLDPAAGRFAREPIRLKFRIPACMVLLSATAYEKMGYDF